MPRRAITTGGVMALALCAGGALAQSVSPTPSDPTSAQIDSWIAGNHGDVDEADAQAAPGRRLRDGAVHGEVGASIGSGGYRSAYGVATMPVGDRGDLTVGLADAHLGAGNRGYGGRSGGGDRRSLFVGLDLNGAPARDACDPLQARPWNGAQAPLAPVAQRCGPAAPPSADVAPR